MKRLSARNCHLTLACLFTILTACGCSPRIDCPAIADKVGKTDPQVKKFLDIFPNADVSPHTSRSFGEVFPDPRNQHVHVESKLADGYALLMSRSLRVESDGVAFDFEDQPWQYYLVLPNMGGSLPLNEAEFNALLAARGDLDSLRPFGMDFSLPPMDVKKVIDGVRKLYPPARELHEAFPDAWTQVDKPTFTQRGRFYSVADLADVTRPPPRDRVQLSVSHEILVAADGIGVELAAEPNKDISGQMSLYIDSAAGPGGNSTMVLTPEQFQKILAAKGTPAIVQRVWSERPRPERKPERPDGVLPDGKVVDRTP